MNNIFDKCNLCPRECLVNRNNGNLGWCQSGNKIKIAKAYLHKWEEPCISGENGSGTIFFSGCNLRCVYCQNYYISELNNGIEITIERFSQICLELEQLGATNINLVTPSHYIPLLVEGLKLAKKEGLKIPIVYNSSGYEKVESLELLVGLIDIYLPDFKYYEDIYGLRYSKCDDYCEVVKEAINEMYRQCPKCIFDKKGNMIKGVIVRHLVLPSREDDSRKIIKYLYTKYKNNIFYSIMSQYTPIRKCKYEELNKTIDMKIYDEIIDYAWSIGIRNCFIQEDGCAKESFIPDFDFKG